ncbi:MAG TPA: TonB-dependent receptor, partial [bacterium]|nr:TonB-dependent receptor [bacterium]
MKFVLLTVVMACWSGMVQAQTPAPTASPSLTPLFLISGQILEKGTKDPVLGGSLYIEALVTTPVVEAAANTAEAQMTPAISPTAVNTPVVTKLSADADLKGNYKISVPAGSYRLVVAGEGFKKITVGSYPVNQNTQKTFFLERDGFTLPEVLVSTDKVAKTQVSHEALSKQELTEVPGTQEDVLKALQALPGVITAGSLDGQLLVRGSGPDDNQYYVDNIPIGFPYHFGIVSTLDSNLIKDIDFYSGGFGPQFANSMGGLVDLTQRDPREDRWGFRADVNLFLSEGEVEGPIDSKSSLAIAGRRSYLDLFIKDFSGSQGDIEVPEFSDYQVKYSYNPTPKVHWDFVALGSADSVSGTLSASATVAQNDPSLAGAFNFNDGYNSQGLNLRDTSDDKNTLVNTLYHTNTYFNYSLGAGLYEDTTVEDFGDKVSVTHDFDEDTSLEGGLQYDHFINSLNAYFIIIPTEPGAQNNFNLTTANKFSSQDTTNSDDFSAYLNQKFKTLEKKLELSVGGRLDYVNSDATLFLTPRASAAYHLTGDTTLKASYGYYDEAPDRITGYPFLDANLGNPHLAPEQSIASVLGFEQKLDESGLLFRVE